MKILISLTVVVFLTTCLLYIMHPNRFDPDKHICERTCKDIFDESMTAIVLPKKCFQPLEPYDDYMRDIIWEKCTSYRPKTFCETCLDAWTDECDKECKCNGYADTDRIIRGYPCPDSCKTRIEERCVANFTVSYGKVEESFIPENHSCTTLGKGMMLPIGIDPSNVTFRLINKSITQCEQCYEYEQKCTSARPLTECEKGSSDYIVDYKFPKSGVTYCSIEENPPEGVIKCEPFCREKTECEKGNPDFIEDYECHHIKHSIMTYSYCGFVCRKKTIEDYSCDELKTVIWLDMKYCPDDNKFLENRIYCPGEGPFSPSQSESYSTKTLKRIYLSKGCEI